MQNFLSILAELVALTVGIVLFLPWANYRSGSERRISRAQPDYGWGNPDRRAAMRTTNRSRQSL